MADWCIDDLPKAFKNLRKNPNQNCMESFLSMLLKIAVLLFAAASMLSVGLGNTVREIIDPLRHSHGVFRALVANFVLVPLLAFGVARLLSLEQPLETGLMLIAMPAGAPFMIKLTEHAEHDVARAARGAQRHRERMVDCDAALSDDASAAGHWSVRQRAFSTLGGTSAARHEQDIQHRAGSARGGDVPPEYP
jgi:hypothetical protein